MTTVDASIPLGIKTNTLQDAMTNMSSLIGVKQQQQQLAQSQVKTAQDQNMLQEQQALGALNPTDYTDPKTGIIDADRYMKDAIAATPRTGLGVQRATAVYQAQNAQTQVNKAGQDLNRDVRGDVAGRFAALSTDPGSTYNDYIKTGDAIKKDNPRASSLVDSYLSQLSPQEDVATTHKRAAVLNRAVLPVGENQPKPTMVDTGAELQPGAISPTTGAFAAGGPPVRKTLAPTQTLPYVRAAATAGTEGSVSAKSDEELYNEVTTNANKASQVRSLAKDVADLSDTVQTGPLSKEAAAKWSAVKQTFGYKTTADDPQTRRQLLGKMAAQLRLQAEQANGASTDAARATVESAYPDPDHMDPAAIKEAARYAGGQAGIAADRGTVAAKQRAANGGQSSAGLRAVDQQFMQDADPKVYVYKNLPAGQERQDYLRRHFVGADGKVDAAALQAFKDKSDRLAYHGAQ